MRGTIRLLLVLAAAALALGSAATNNQTPAPQAMPATASPQGGAYGPPPSQPMEGVRAHGLWKTNFGPVKIEVDEKGAPSGVMGVWVYDREGQEVIGYFQGPLDGNVLEFSWQEPAEPQVLKGAGYLVFDPAGRSFAGRWWTDSRDRSGEWNGWRGEQAGASTPGALDQATPPTEPGTAAPPPDGATPPAGTTPPAEPPPGTAPPPPPNQ